jgi:hypothetical protein
MRKENPMTRLAIILVAIWVAAHYALIPMLKAWELPKINIISVDPDAR